MLPTHVNLDEALPHRFNNQPGFIGQPCQHGSRKRVLGSVVECGSAWLV